MNTKQMVKMTRKSELLKKQHAHAARITGHVKYCKGCHIKGCIPFGISGIGIFRESKGSIDGLRNTCKTCESEKVNLSVLTRLVQEQDDAGVKPDGNTVMVYCPTCERWLPILKFSRRSTGVGCNCRGCYVLSRYKEEIVDSIVYTKAGFDMASKAVRNSHVDDIEYHPQLNQLEMSDFTDDDIDIEPEPTETKVKRVLLALGIAVIAYIILR